MKIRRTARLAALTAAVVVLPSVLACGDSGTDTDENPLVGTWSATSVVLNDVEVLVGTSFSITATFGSDGTFSASYSGNTNFWCGGAPSCTETGTYTFTSSTLTICDPGCEAPGPYTISGNTLTFDLLGTVFTFVRA